MKEQTPQEKEYNRMAMAKVRSDVKRFVEGETKGMAHLGEYPRTMEDAVRTIIALQDMLDKSMEKHARATEHLLDQKEIQESVGELAAHMLNDATESVLRSSETVGQLQMDLKRSQEENARLMKQCQELDEANLQANIENHELRELMDAHKMVLRSSLNEEGLG